MPIYTPTGTGAQDGYNNGGVWTESETTLKTGGTGVGGGEGGPMGFRFKLHSEFDSESRPIEPALVWPSFSLSLTVAVSDDDGIVDSIPFWVYGVLEAAPEPYSNDLLPRNSPRNETEFRLLDANGDDNAATYTMSDGVGTVLTWPYLDMSSLVSSHRSSQYNGFLCLTVQRAGGNNFGTVEFHSSEGATASFFPALTTTESAFTTGMLDGPSLHQRSRMRHDPRTGMPVASIAMVRDGFREGQMLSQEAWDPEDPPERYVPDPNEGVVDDEV